jgi:hypothetical protein
MWNIVFRLFVFSVIVAGCAHRGAVRVECEGPLRPINRPAPLNDAPVTVEPASPDAPPRGEIRP